MQPKQLPSSAVAAIIAGVAIVLGFIGWRYLNPPPLQPVGAQGGTVQPSVVPDQSRGGTGAIGGAGTAEPK